LWGGVARFNTFFAHLYMLYKNYILLYLFVYTAANEYLMMKHAMNFRLNQQAINILLLLEKNMHTTKTAVIEAALEDYAKRRLPKRHELLAYAGILKNDEAEIMLNHIRASRRNKNIELRS
jgi:hypothetical protein